MRRPTILLLPLGALLLGALLLGAACGHGAAGHGTEEPPTREPLKEPRPPTSQPTIPDGPGMEALRRWALTCYDIGCRHNSVFAGGGQVVIRWVADRNADLLQLDFAVDSFRGWEINAAGETLADCVSRLARTGSVRWSPAGAAPLRLSPPK